MVEEKKEEKKEKRHSSRHSDKHSDKQTHKSDKSEEKEKEKKSKHHKHKHKDKHSTKDKDNESHETGEKSKPHKSKHKHHKCDKKDKDKDKHKKEDSVAFAAAAAAAAAATAAAAASAAAAAAAAAVNPTPAPTVVVSQQSETITPQVTPQAPKVNSNSNATASTALVSSSSSSTATSSAATTTTAVSQPMCSKPEPKHMPLLNTSSASETLLTQSLPPRRPPNIPSSVAVANIIRNTEATLERVIVNELKKDSYIPSDNGKIRLSSDENNSKNSTKSSAVELPRRYPAVTTQGVPQVGTHSVPPQVGKSITTAAASIYTQPHSVPATTTAGAITVPSTSNFATATTTTTSLSSIQPTAKPPSAVLSSGSGGHWSQQNTIQVISRTSNAISPIVPGTKPPVVAVTGVVKSEDIKRTLPVEGVEGHKPKEREKGIAGILPRSEPVNIVAPVQDNRGVKNLETIRDLSKDSDLKSRELRIKEDRERSEERPLASALKEPIQVYRDPNLTDTEVIHVNSVQHQLAYHQRGASGDPSPTHSLSAAAAASAVASQHSTLHPPPSTLSAGIGASPSAFVPSAGRIPSHHPLARHPMFSPHVQAIYQHPLAAAAGQGHIPAAAYPAHLAVLNQQHDLHTRQHLAGLVHQESLARLHHPGLTFAQLQHAASTAAALQGMHPGMSAAQLQQLWQQQQASGMPIPPTWIIQQHHEELERHLHQQAAQQASEKSPSVAHAAVAPNQSHHDTPRTPQTPQPASASASQRDLSATTSRESSVRHYAEFPPSDAQAAVQRHFQESLRKLHLPYTFSTSPVSGSITAGTAIPKTESGPAKDGDRQVRLLYSCCCIGIMFVITNM